MTMKTGHEQFWATEYKKWQHNTPYDKLAKFTKTSDTNYTEAMSFRQQNFTTLHNWKRWTSLAEHGYLSALQKHSPKTTLMQTKTTTALAPSQQQVKNKVVPTRRVPGIPLHSLHFGKSYINLSLKLNEPQSCGGDIWWTRTNERQAWCYLQVKLCDPRLSTLSVSQ